MGDVTISLELALLSSRVTNDQVQQYFVLAFKSYNGRRKLNYIN